MVREREGSREREREREREGPPEMCLMLAWGGRAFISCDFLNIKLIEILTEVIVMAALGNKHILYNIRKATLPHNSPIGLVL